MKATKETQVVITVRMTQAEAEHIYNLIGGSSDTTRMKNWKATQEQSDAMHRLYNALSDAIDAV